MAIFCPSSKNGLVVRRWNTGYKNRINIGTNKKDYLKHITQEYPSEKSRNYDYVYLDCNYMCHYLIYKCKSNADFYSKIFDYWEYLSSTINIKKE